MGDLGNAEGGLHLALQVYDLCTDTTTTRGRVTEGGKDPLETTDESQAFLSQAGRCHVDRVPPEECATDAECGEGAFCEADTCDTAAAGTCRLHPSLTCGADAECWRCVLRQPATCLVAAIGPSL